MDEPTSSLSENEVEICSTPFAGCATAASALSISHRMSELDAVADRVTVLRDGQYIDTVKMEDTDHEHLISLMVGRSIETFFVKNPHSTDQVILEVNHLRWGSMVKDASFTLRRARCWASRA
jgi:ribose transport system ATP-binding protein